MVEQALARANAALEGESANERRERVIMALHRARRECHLNDHDWDVADVMKVLDQEGLL